MPRKKQETEETPKKQFPEKTVTKLKLNLKCFLTEPEKIDQGANMAECLNEVEQLKVEKKASAKSYDTRIEVLDNRVGRFSSSIRAGYEFRDVDAEQVIDYAAGRAYQQRLDTDEVVQGSDRPLNESELQMTLPADEEEVEELTESLEEQGLEGSEEQAGSEQMEAEPEEEDGFDDAAQAADDATTEE